MTCPTNHPPETSTPMLHGAVQIGLTIICDYCRAKIILTVASSSLINSPPTSTVEL
jgi:hypothetical protein